MISISPALEYLFKLQTLFLWFPFYHYFPQSYMTISGAFWCSSGPPTLSSKYLAVLFKKQFSKANHLILGYVGKGIIFLIPLYMQFITLIVCGTDLFIFCSKDFRDTVNLLSVWDPNENQQQTVNLIYKSFDCRSKLLKRSPLSMCLPIIVITNILIILRSVLINFKTSRISPFPPEAQNTNQELELRTISGQNDPSQQPEDSPHSHHQAASDDNHCPSVGAATGVITVLVITINAVNAGLIMDSGGNALFFTIPDLLVTTILSLCLCFKLWTQKVYRTFLCFCNQWVIMQIIIL